MSVSEIVTLTGISISSVKRYKKELNVNRITNLLV